MNNPMRLYNITLERRVNRVDYSNSRFNVQFLSVGHNEAEAIQLAIDNKQIINSDTNINADLIPSIYGHKIIAE